MPSFKSGYFEFLNFRYYPALLLTYAAGISALAAKRFRNLASILREPTYREEPTRRKLHAIEQLHVSNVFLEGTADKWVPRPNAEGEYTPANNYLYERLRPVLQDYLPNDTQYEETFDIFEYLFALNYMDLLEDCSWSPIGRFVWRYRLSFLDAKDWKYSPMADFIDTGLRLGENWELLQAGFFQGSILKLNYIVARHQEWVRQVVKRL